MGCCSKQRRGESTNYNFSLNWLLVTSLRFIVYEPLIELSIVPSCWGKQHMKSRMTSITKYSYKEIMITSIISFAYSKDASLQYIICSNLLIVVNENFVQFMRANGANKWASSFRAIERRIILDWHEMTHEWHRNFSPPRQIMSMSPSLLAYSSISSVPKILVKF